MASTCGGADVGLSYRTQSADHPHRGGDFSWPKTGTSRWPLTAWIESFNGRLRDELLNAWRFDSLREARVVIWQPPPTNIRQSHHPTPTAAQYRSLTSLPGQQFTPLEAANPQITNPDVILAGQVLHIP